MSITNRPKDGDFLPIDIVDLAPIVRRFFDYKGGLRSIALVQNNRDYRYDFSYTDGHCLIGERLYERLDFIQKDCGFPLAPAQRNCDKRQTVATILTVMKANEIYLEPKHLAALCFVSAAFVSGMMKEIKAAERQRAEPPATIAPLLTAFVELNRRATVAHAALMPCPAMFGG